MPPNVKVHSKRLVELRLLRTGAYRERILLFYAMFGTQPEGEHLTVWKPDEVCRIIGWVKDGVPQIKSYRKTLRRLQTEGLIEKIVKTTRYGPMYSFRTLGGDELCDAALDILNNKTWASTIYCRA